MKTYYEVGEIFEVRNDKIEIVEVAEENYKCNNCYFYNCNCVMDCHAKTRKDKKFVNFVKIGAVTENNGGSTDYYKLPAGATELQDLIEYKDMSFSVGNIFKSCYRLGNCEHSDRVRDLNKIIWFAQRELNKEGNNE